MFIRNCNLADGPLTFTVGDVTVKIVRLAGRTATVGIDAPREMAITFEESTTITEAVEKAIQPVVEGEDDNA